MVEAPEVSVSICAAAVTGAVQVIQGSVVWRIGRVVVERSGGLVLQLKTLGATGRLRVEAHRDRATRLPVGEGTRWIAIPLQLPSGTVELVEQPDVYLAADCRVGIWAAEAHRSPIHVFGWLGGSD